MGMRKRNIFLSVRELFFDVFISANAISRLGVHCLYLKNATAFQKSTSTLTDLGHAAGSHCRASQFKL